MDISGFFPYPTTERPGSAAGDLEFFPHGTEEEWATLLSYAEMQLFDAGATVMTAGDHGRALYLLTDGTLEVVSRRRRAPPLLTATTVFGELSFFDGRPRSVTLRARTDGEMLRLGRDAFDALCAREPRLGHDILLDLGRIVSLRLRLVEELGADAAG